MVDLNRGNREHGSQQTVLPFPRHAIGISRGHIPANDQNLFHVVRGAVSPTEDRPTLSVSYQCRPQGSFQKDIFVSQNRSKKKQLLSDIRNHQHGRMQGFLKEMVLFRDCDQGQMGFIDTGFRPLFRVQFDFIYPRAAVYYFWAAEWKYSGRIYA